MTIKADIPPDTPMQFDVADGVARLTIDRPAKKNALTGAMYNAIAEACNAVNDSPDIGVLLLSASGDTFCAGNDIGDFISGAGADLGRLHEPDYNPSANAVRALMALKKPLVAAVEGDAIGFGATMLLHADFIYAGQSARFRFPFVDLGIAPEAGSSQILVQQLGRVRAAELLLGAEAAEAAKLLEYGLINDVTETGGALARAAAMAAALAAKPRESLVETKRLMRREAEPLDARVAEEFRAVGRRVGSEEAQAIFAAFFTRKS